MRLLLIVSGCLALAACAPPQPVEPVRVDPTTEDYYKQTVERLVALNQQAGELFRAGKFDEASAMVTRGQAMQSRLLAAPRPTLAAMEACSDLDDLYGRLLLRNQHYDWASSIFQKNVIRWKAWKPKSEDTERRLQVARDAVAECERRGKK